MTSFKFPPPPPPPPKASSNDNQQLYPSHRGGHSRGRGDGGRGRGGNNRGGAGSFDGRARAGQGSAHSQGPRGGYHNNGEGPPQSRGSSSLAQGQWHQPIAMAQPSISNAPIVSSTLYATPSFSTPPSVDPNAFVQAMSFMATQAGAQSMAAFASHMTGAASPLLAPSTSPQKAQHAPRYSPLQQSGQKRKWEEHHHNGTTQPHPPLQRKPLQQGSKPPRAKAAVAPAIPTFGFALPTPQSMQSSRSIKGNKSKDDRKGKVRLGLTHEPEQDESSEGEDVDEELELGTKLKGGGFTFEHEGEHISLQTAGDIAEWIKDRRRNFPTHQKAMEKAEAAAIKRRNELNFVRKLKGKPLQPETTIKKDVQPEVHARSKRDEKKQEELAALRKKLHESMTKKNKKKEALATVDLGLGYGSATESDEEGSSVLSESSVVSSSAGSSEDSDSGSEGSDAAPEPISSKLPPASINVPPRPPPVSAQTERRPGKEKICNSWRQHGKCSFGHSCKFKHPPKEATRTGLYEKLVEQELVKADQLALDAIKFLGQNGFLG